MWLDGIKCFVSWFGCVCCKFCVLVEFVCEVLCDIEFDMMWYGDYWQNLFVLFFDVCYYVMEDWIYMLLLIEVEEVVFVGKCKCCLYMQQCIGQQGKKKV